MAKRFKLELGDVFTIPLSDNEVGFGQSVTPHKKTSGGFMIAVYPCKRNNDQIINIEDIVSTEPLFLGYTFDSLLSDLPKWKIIGNYVDNIRNIKMPFHRLGTPPDEIYLIDVTNTRVAEISEDIFNKLSYKSEISPIYYEEALKAHFGLLAWNDEEFDELLYKHTLKSNEIAKTVLP